MKDDDKGEISDWLIKKLSAIFDKGNSAEVKRSDDGTIVVYEIKKKRSSYNKKSDTHK